ncbi:MAG: hypothetical protein K6U88_15010 [Dehalococcoidia bacterium]|nr:hypothetical protein [Dehalococcoidia bacterium]
MRSQFAIAGHPIHPTLVAVPIGLFVWTLVSDIVFLARGRDQMWYDIAFWTGIAAIVTALVAALPGFGDYVTMAIDTDARGIATAAAVTRPEGMRVAVEGGAQFLLYGTDLVLLRREAQRAAEALAPLRKSPSA